MKDKLQVLVAIDEPPEPLWDQLSHLAVFHFVREGLSAYHQLTSHAFDLAFLDWKLLGLDGPELLRRVHAEQLCPSVVLTSASPSFPYAQQGILCGVSAYFLRPLQAGEVEQALRKVQARLTDPALVQTSREVALALRREGAAAYVRLGEQRLTAPDPSALAGVWRDLYNETVNQVYLQYPWMKLYHKADQFALMEVSPEADPKTMAALCLENLNRVADALCTLFPPAQDRQLEEIEVALLTSVDQDPQQKDIAEQFYLASSTLSARFQRQLGISYRAYLTRLKLRRAGYLLRYTTLPLGEIPKLLGYKDKEYFAKLFAQQTGTPFQRTLSQG